ncbi:MAG: hypothetical protein ABI862_11560 [Ilumatobacteraceae bacterium]
MEVEPWAAAPCGLWCCGPGFDVRAAHPELALALWASQHLDAPTRAAATMCTSGERCPMCAAAHVWTGIGRFAYVLSSPMIADFVEPGISIDLRATDIVAASNVDIAVEGPCHELAAEAAALFPRR